MKPVLLAIVALAGCGLKQIDPCAGVTGTCLALQVEGSGKIDRASVHVTANGIDVNTTSDAPKGATALPIAVALVFDNQAAGMQVDATIAVVGMLNGAGVGTGSTSATVVGGRHTTARVTLTMNGISPGDDMSMPGDLASIMPDGGCAAASTYCEGSSTLRVCRSDGLAFDAVACGLGCSSSGTAHCNDVYPTAPATVADTKTSGLTAITFADTTLHGDTGVIDGVRAANSDPAALEVKNGIGFHLVGGTGIFIFAAVTIPSGVTIHLGGPNPIAVVSESDLVVAGVIDAQGPCTAGVAVAGGSVGAASNTGSLDANGLPGGGQGPGGAGTAQGMSNCGAGGGGGAGHGEAGGKGGNGGCFVVAAGGLGGAGYDAPALTPLRGGSGGGSGGAGTQGGPGGSGGGALQLVAVGTITIGGGTAAGGVNAGGCGGRPATNLGGNGGGGSGGAVLVEAPTIHLTASGVIAANGGGGAGGYMPASAGANGGLDDLRAAPGAAGTGERGGRGGAAGTPKGEAAADIMASANGTGGGGGAVGRIRLNSRTASATVDSGGKLSPAVIDQDGNAMPLCSQATIDIH